jgi:Fic family protein
MDIMEFKAGTYKQQYQYRSFTPSPVNTDWTIRDPELIGLLSQADIKLGELNAFSQLIPDIDFFIKMHVRREANESSRIEGTQTTIEEVLQKPASLEGEKRNDWLEVHNYIDAMHFAMDKLAELPISGRLMKETHKILMAGVRGMHKSPGEFRQSQNWIGGATLADAVYIPPVHTEIPDLINDLEKFINNENDNLPALIKAAIAHYQFETIHPFLDGNGRIGRLLITLYLISSKILIKPCLYLSDFFEKNRMLYYDNLSRARANNDMKQWLKFFLAGVHLSAVSSINAFKGIIELRKDIETTRIAKLGKKQKLALQLMNHLYAQPIMDQKAIAEALNINVSTAGRLIDDFMRLGILEEMTGFKRNRIFIFREYVELYKK